MPGFVLAEHVDELTFDFAPYGPSGKITEPSAAQIQNFRGAIADMFNETLPTEDIDPNIPTQEMAKRLVEFIGKDQTEATSKILHAVADVCTDSPSYDVLDALPYRHQQAFLGWISGVFLLPPVPTSATNG